MSHRFTTWWRALSVVLLSLATVTWPSAARADTTAHFTVVHQEATTTMAASGSTRFSTTLRISPDTVRAQASVTIYPVLVTRGEIAPIISGVGVSTKPLSTTGLFSLSCERQGVATFNVTLYIRRLKSPPRTCGSVTPRLRLHCSGVGCAGVYPIRYTIKVNGSTTTKWSLLAVQAARVVRPLQVNFIATLSPNVFRHQARSLGVLRTIGRYASSPLTLSADYVTLSTIELRPAITSEWRQALGAALTSGLHRAIDAPPANIDFAGLAANRLTTQVPQQLTLSTDLLASLTGRFVDEPVLLSGTQSAADLLALAKAGFDDVVVPEDDLSVAPSSTLTWGAPFHVDGAGSLTTLSVDQPLSKLVTNSSIEPGRRAALTVATLAFLHFEAPYAAATRSVVLEAPVSSLSKTLLADLLSSFKGDPFSHLAPLTPSFNSSLLGANGAPVTRTLASSSNSSQWSNHNVTSLLTLIGAVNSYAQAVKSGDIATVLRVAVARIEIVGGADQRQIAINAANNVLNAQLAEFSIDQSAITLAGSGTAIPVTVISRLHYTVDAVIHLVTDRLVFPKGNTVAVTMNSPTQSIRVPANSPRGNSLTLQVLLTTPNGQVVLARTAVQVHIAGTSVVGYLLTFASLLVLAVWWWRTIRRRPKGRHAR